MDAASGDDGGIPHSIDDQLADAVLRWFFNSLAAGVINAVLVVTVDALAAYALGADFPVAAAVNSARSESLNRSGIHLGTAGSRC
ncbi:MAG TPA: hypothetical protein VGL39_07750 [Jatrophihabitantaceae bacterium]